MLIRKVVLCNLLLVRIPDFVNFVRHKDIQGRNQESWQAHHAGVLALSHANHQSNKLKYDSIMKWTDR